MAVEEQEQQPTKQRRIEPVYREIGARIRAARLQRGLTQAALAAKIGHARLSVNAMETARQRVQVHTLYEIARWLDVPIAALLPSES